MRMIFQGERIYSNLTRLVVLVWLFVVLILSSSYTASLSSMLTVQRLKPNVTDIEWLRRSNLKVGCDGDSFVRNYLQEVLEFKSENILNVSSEYKYHGEFESNHITAAFMELPYEKVFITRYCNKYTASTPTYRFGGLGFVFQKGSPIAADFSEAILKLSENGVLKALEEKWLASSTECSTNVTNNKTESLSLHNFWGLYLVSGATSTVCALLCLVEVLKKYNRCQDASGGNTSERSIWGKVVGLARHICNRRKNNPGRALSFGRTTDAEEWSSSSRWKYTSPDETPDNLEACSESETELQYIPGCS